MRDIRSNILLFKYFYIHSWVYIGNLLYAVYCAEYEHTSKILLTGGKNYVPLYTVKYLPTEIKKKRISYTDAHCSMEDVLSQTILINCVFFTVM